MNQRKEASAYTKSRQDKFLRDNDLDINDRSDYEDADRGLLAQLSQPIDGGTNVGFAWSPDTYAFLDGDKAAPDTVNPSLWRQAKLNTRHGLFKVKDGIWQVRGYDVANITFIKGNTGYIVLDTLTNIPAAKASLELLYEHVEKLPITGIIYTHSHVDHWGGVTALVSEDDVKQRNIPIIAPDRFMEKAVSENILAGNAMLRRGSYMFGIPLPRDEKSNVDAGLGKSFGSGALGLIAPTVSIKEPVETHIVDGVELVFQLTPETEAPAEMTVFLPGYKAFCPAELANQTMHNIYTIRGAETRDAKAWAHYLNNAVHEYGGKFDVVFTTHNWPVWSEEKGVEYLKKQRDIYKYIHDQTLRLANHGYTETEVAERIKLPKSLSETWSVRGNYGSLSHNSKAVFNRYLGYYDAHPASLHELPPEDAAKKYVAYMGGEDNILEKAQADFEKGEYRWVAQVLRQLVFANPENERAKALLADVFEQLGYAAESAPWRNAYLTGTQELREGVKKSAAVGGFDIFGALSVSDLLDFLAVRLNGEKADGRHLILNFDFPDIDEQYAVYVENATLNYRKGKQEQNADASVKIGKSDLPAVLADKERFVKFVATGKAQISGNPQKLAELFSLLDTFDNTFNIVLP